MYRRTLLTLTLISMTCSPIALAQGQSAKNAPPTPPEPPKFGAGAPTAPKYEAVQFQDLPEFTGQAKLILQHQSKLEHGTSWIQVRRAKESTQQVHDWYASVLRMNKWTIVHDTAKVIIANKSGNMFNLQINGGMDPVNPTEFELTYFLLTAKRGGSQTD
jgi:hypothetical protein